jgi:CheY-like chemotaxis protein
MRLLFVDDDPENVELVARTLREGLGAEVLVVTTVEEAVAALHTVPYDLVVTDLFIPLGHEHGGALGPRARRYAEQLEHLGGLVLLDELDRVEPAPLLLAHTACTDRILIELLGERVVARVRKPAPTEVLLDAVLSALRGR